MLKFTNKTKKRIFLAIGYFDREENKWFSEGWWLIESGITITPLSEPLSQRYYYYYARTKKKKYVWNGNGSGDTHFYVKSVPYEFKLSQSSSYSGYSIEKFAKLDTGDAKDYTFGFTINDPKWSLSDDNSPLSADEQKLIRMISAMRNNS
jgi:uncharacterized membrane protein